MNFSIIQAVNDGNKPSLAEFLVTCALDFGTRPDLRLGINRTDPYNQMAESRHQRDINQAKSRVANVELWSSNEADIYADAAYRKACGAYERTVDKRNSACEQFELLLDQLNCWVPSAKKHQVFKAFVIGLAKEQIAMNSSFQDLMYPVRLSGEQYQDHMLVKNKRTVDWLIEKSDRAKKAAEEGTTNHRALIRSLMDETVEV